MPHSVDLRPWSPIAHSQVGVEHTDLALGLVCRMVVDFELAKSHVCSKSAPFGQYSTNVVEGLPISPLVVIGAAKFPQFACGTLLDVVDTKLEIYRFRGRDNSSR